MSKRNKKIDSKKSNLSNKEHVIYSRNMAFIWFGITISQLFVIILAIPYFGKIDKIISENSGSLLIYIITIILWYIYRIKSRLKYKTIDNFEEKLSTDFSFSKKFNNAEITKTFITYLMISIPFFYYFEIAQNILNYFGYESSGFGGDVRALMISIISSLAALFPGLIGSYIYDKIKNKLP